jgi:hypothetical protein
LVAWRILRNGQVAFLNGDGAPFLGRGEVKLIGWVGDLPAVEAVVVGVVGEQVVPLEKEEPQ